MRLKYRHDMSLDYHKRILNRIIVFFVIGVFFLGNILVSFELLPEERPLFIGLYSGYLFSAIYVGSSILFRFFDDGKVKNFDFFILSSMLSYFYFGIKIFLWIVPVLFIGIIMLIPKTVYHLTMYLVELKSSLR